MLGRQGARGEGGVHLLQQQLVAVPALLLVPLLLLLLVVKLLLLMELLLLVVLLLLMMLLLQLMMLLLLLLVVLLLELLLVVLLLLLKLLLLLELLLLLKLLLLLLWLEGAPLLEVLPLLKLHPEAVLRGGLRRGLLVLLEAAAGVDWSLVLVLLLLGPGPGPLLLVGALLDPGPWRVAQACLLAVVLEPRLLLLLDLLLERRHRRVDLVLGRGRAPAPPGRRQGCRVRSPAAQAYGGSCRCRVRPGSL